MKKLIFLFVCVFVVFLNQSCSEKGTKLKFNCGLLYYTDEVQQADAEKLGSYLMSEGFFDAEKKIVQIDRNGKTWEFRMVVDNAYADDEQYLYLLGFFSKQLSKAVFNNDPVDIHLCNKKLETLRLIPYNGL